jgi:hypothetical protein
MNGQKKCVRHQWGKGVYAGVCMRCSYGAVDGPVARAKNARQAEAEREEDRRRSEEGR